MPYRIDVTASARKSILSLPRKDQARIVGRIAALAVDPRPNNCKKLVDGDPVYRIRAGNYRVIYVIQDDILVVTVVRVAHRRDVYR